jgi:hypothetical protein
MYELTRDIYAEQGERLIKLRAGTQLTVVAEIDANGVALVRQKLTGETWAVMAWELPASARWVSE